MNGCVGQLKGPFKANEDVFSIVQKNAIAEVEAITHLGIQTEPGKVIVINNKEIEIGNIGIYELRNIKIKSLYFKQDVDKNTIIDYAIKLVEEG